MYTKMMTALSATEFKARVFWILLSRIIIYGLLFTASVRFLKTDSYIYWILIGYGILAIGFLLYVLAFKNRINSRFLKIFIGAQIVCELFIESILVNHVGGNFSPLLVLFALSIVSAMLVYSLAGTLLARKERHGVLSGGDWMAAG